MGGARQTEQPNGSGDKEQNVRLCQRQTERVAARVMLSDCEISRVGSTSSDDQSGRRHKVIGGLWWQQWRKRGTA
jgi:exopolysaccharide biosynthesis protein